MISTLAWMHLFEYTVLGSFMALSAEMSGDRDRNRIELGVKVTEEGGLEGHRGAGRS